MPEHIYDESDLINVHHCCGHISLYDPDQGVRIKRFEVTDKIAKR